MASSMFSLSRRHISQMRMANVQRLRCLATEAQASASSDATTPTPPPTTHYKITLRRSAIGLGDSKQATLVSLGIHRRHQTVYHRHSPETAGKILAVKELLEVENVPTELVKTKEQQTLDRRATRGYRVVGSRRGAPIDV